MSRLISADAFRAFGLTTTPGRYDVPPFNSPPAISFPPFRVAMMFSSPTELTSNTPFASGRSPTVTASPVSATIDRTPSAHAPSRSDCNAITLRSRHERLTSGSTPKRCLKSAANVSPESFIFARALSVMFTKSIPLIEAYRWRIGSTSVPRGGLISTHNRGLSLRAPTGRSLPNPEC